MKMSFGRARQKAAVFTMAPGNHPRAQGREQRDPKNFPSLWPALRNNGDLPLHHLELQNAGTCPHGSGGSDEATSWNVLNPKRCFILA